MCIFCFIASGLTTVGSYIDFSFFGKDKNHVEVLILGKQHEILHKADNIKPGHILGTRLDFCNISK